MTKTNKKSPPKGLMDDDDDDEPLIQPKKVQSVKAPAPATKPAGEQRIAPNQAASKQSIAHEPAKLKPQTPPPGYFSICTAQGNRVLIMDRMGSDWRDLFVYAYHMGCTVQVKAADLFPVEDVKAAITFIQSIRDLSS